MPVCLGVMIILLHKSEKALNNMGNKMYKLLATLQFIIITSISFSKNITDTTILFNEKTSNGFEKKIYIDESKNSKFYNLISVFDFFKNPINTSKAISTGSVQGNWLSLHVFQNKLYAYYPCDEGNNYRIQINNDSLIEYLTEVNFFKIIKRKKEKKNLTILQLLDSRGIQFLLNIHELPSGVYLFEKTNGIAASYYSLMIPSKKLREYPIIVNICPEKSDEFKFDVPNYKLLQNLLKE